MSTHISNTLLPVSGNRSETIDKNEKMMYCIESGGLLNVEEVSNILRISRATTYRLINSKQLIAKKLGSRTVVTTDAINNFINNLEEYEGGRNVF